MLLKKKENLSLRANNMIEDIKKVGVIGAGTMGIGIAEVAASHNQQVYLYDLDFEFANDAKSTLAKRLQSRVNRNKISPERRQSIVDNVFVIADLNKISDCQLVIEAIIENLEVKQKLFKKLQGICHPDVLFASNTSSISVTAIAAALDKPENMIGLHFFNPAPVMKLVEVIAGLKSSKTNLDKGLQLCKHWDKTAVLAQSSPGFIVNRVARPFYGEALKMLQERLFTPETMDALITSAGFRMGPFTLMDLIGIDINYSVSQTVFASMYHDPRYRPSLIQAEMVAANLLGKKTGEGFYKYDGTDKAKVVFESEQEPAKHISVCKDSTQLDLLTTQLKNNNYFVIDEHKGGVSIIIDDCAILLSNGQTCLERSTNVVQKHMAQIDLTLNFSDCEIIHIAFDRKCPAYLRNKVVGTFQKIGKNVLICDDVPALIVMRTVCMLINEAADAVENCVCSAIDVDMAMRKGVNYPIGLIDWADRIGYHHVIETLENLHHWFGDDRYRVSPWLRKRC